MVVLHAYTRELCRVEFEHPRCPPGSLSKVLALVCENEIFLEEVENIVSRSQSPAAELIYALHVKPILVTPQRFNGGRNGIFQIASLPSIEVFTLDG